MKRQNLFPLLAAVVLLAVGSVYAQMGNSYVKAKIPFDFTVGNTTLPAGEYRISAMNSLGTLSVVGQGSAMSLIGSHAVLANDPSATTKLVFHQYGDRYFLYRIWVEGEERGRELGQTRLEQELASNRRPGSVAITAQK